MHDLEPTAISGQPDQASFVADALEAISIKFVGSVDEIENSESYSPEFAHQHFGESEKIVGYKNLRVSVLYSDSTLFLTSLIKYDEKANDTSDFKRDDIEYKVKDALPATQLDAYLSIDKLKQKLAEQKKFKPFGEQITKFYVEDPDQKRIFELYKFEKKEDIDDRFEEGAKYLERAQGLAHWYIDAVCYTDYEDPRFFYYFLFEFKEVDGSGVYKFAGFATLYRFYHHPDKERIRIAQMLLAPPYRRMGMGTRFMQAINADLCQIESVYDITAEDPADSFLYTRDYVDCVNCAKLPEFAPTNLKNGFSAAMCDAAQQKYKLNKAQSRRVYEILRLHHTNLNIPSEKESFKEMLMKRLKKSVMDPKRDGGRLSRVLQNDQHSLVIAMHALEPDQQSQQLATMYENTMESYGVVLSRLVRYEKDFV